MHRFFAASLCLILYFYMSCCAHAQTSSVPVSIISPEDLREGLPLNVPWHFTGPDGSEHRITPPVRWEKTYGRLLPVMGKGVYRLELQLPADSVGKNLLFDCEMVAGNRFRLYANNQLVGYNGTYPQSTSRITQFDAFKNSSQRLKIRLEVENNTLHWSGLVSPLYLGYTEIIRQQRYRQSLEFNAFFGAFFFIAFFHFVLFVAFRQDKTVLWFGLLYVGLVVYMEFFRMHNLEHLFGDIPLEWSIRGIRIALYSLIPCFFWYGHYLSAQFISRRTAQLFTGVSTGFMVTVVLPGRWHTPLLYLWFLFLLVATLYAFGVLLNNYRERAIRPFLISLSIYAITIVNDMLNALGWLGNGFYGRYGFLSFALTQSGFLAWRLQTNYRNNLHYQQELMSINQNLEQLVSRRTQEVEEKNLELEQMAHFKEEMMDMLLHDLKTPLNVLLTAPNTEDTQVAGQRVKTLIEQLVKSQHTDASRLMLERSPQNMQHMAERGVQWLQPWANTRQITLANLLDSSVTLNIDGPLVERVLQNVLQNALRHSPVGSEVTLSATLEKDIYTLLIQDEGKGIPADLQEKVLQKGVSFAPDGGSTGLGLYFCKQVLMAHDGELSFPEPPISGVYLHFPAHELQRTSLAPLTQSQKERLRPHIEQLQQYEVYEISQILPLLRQVAAHSDILIQTWAEALNIAIREVDETKYRELIHQLLADPDC